MQVEHNILYHKAFSLRKVPKVGVLLDNTGAHDLAYRRPPPTVSPKRW